MNCNIREQLKYVLTCIFRVIYMVADARQRLDFPDFDLLIQESLQAFDDLIGRDRTGTECS